MSIETDLQVATPEEVAKVLRHAAGEMAAACGDLSAAWGDPQAGRVWCEFAKILERAAASCDRAVDKFV